MATKTKIQSELRNILKEYQYTGNADLGEEMYSDVKSVFDAIDQVQAKDQLFNRINVPIEKAEVISQFADKVGIPRSEYYNILGKIRRVSEEDEKDIEYDKDEFKEFRKDVEQLVDKVVNDPTVQQKLSRVNRPKEKSQLIEKFIEMIGIPKHKMYELMGYIEDLVDYK